MSIMTSPEWSPRIKRIIAIFFFLFFLALGWFVRAILPIIIVSALIAFVLNPFVTFLTRRVFRAPRGSTSRRGLATLIVFVVVITTIVISSFVIVPVVGTQLSEFGRRIPGWITELETLIETTLDQPIIFNGTPITLDGENPFIPMDRIEEATGTRDLSQLFQIDQLNVDSNIDAFFSSLGSLSGPAFSFLGGAFSTLINVTFLLMMTFYLLKDGASFIRGGVNLVPDGYKDDARRLVADLADVWNAYLRGQILLGIAMGLAVYIAALALGLPSAATLGIIAGVLEFIPNLGPLIALIPAVFLALVSESATIELLSGVPFAIVVIVVWTLLQQLESVILVPRIMGQNLDLHPLAVIIGILGGAALGGALGVILAAPFMASGRVIVRYVYGKLTGRNPFREVNPEAIREAPTFLAKLMFSFWELSKWLWQRLIDVRNRFRRQKVSS